ncbi:hypothetical protein L249_2650 [Ophiocordyceps polyrhachis-furcata BCC 54312]|uniref:Xylanolytic transcriptional activator regulatory domain-containing protein n=1 Tax=Ophiocordyceps polyrhachis-furcata BCC 54312 TaxID=1330021 RepID=A0A367LSW4_9HYPO|nr:hypothetical protein L249_2650 [Ophiocordyceps polyrhachis-furcata BCC 54312]
MEQIETQASDLRFLARQQQQQQIVDSPSYDDTPSNAQQTASPPILLAGDNSAGKRKAADEGAQQRQTRSKRNRRRKIKCNGETPCQRCGNLNLACLYAPNCCSNSFRDSDEFKHVVAQLGQLQNEVASLRQTVGLVSPVAFSSPAVASSQRQPSSVFVGSTSTVFDIDVANNTIANMGYRYGDDDAGSSDHCRSSADVALPAPCDPLFDFDKDEVLRLCHFYEDELGVMYPVLKVQAVIDHARHLTPILADARSHQRPPEAINDDKTLQLKMVMCCALVIEQHGHSEKATHLFKSLEDAVNRKLMGEVSSSVANLPLFCLVAGYRFLSNEEILAWRVMGHVVRLCVELGIHQKRGLMGIRDESDRANALHSFWSAYILDRRWAFATGLPFTLQDDEIDPQLPIPDNHPFLVAMITYSRLGAKVWRQGSHFGPALARELRQEEMENLDREILHWWDTVPADIKTQHRKGSPLEATCGLHRLGIWAYLRFVQIRIWLYTPVLHSATSTLANTPQSDLVVNLARDTIRYLDHLNRTTNLYRIGQVFYHQFLASALAVLFLASVHVPVRFSGMCRDEFYMALDLVKDLSAKSWVSKRLWCTIKSLKDVAPRFGLSPADAASRSAASLNMTTFPSLDMTSPTHHHQQSPSPLQQQNESQGRNEDSAWSEHLGGRELQTQLSRIYEDYVGSSTSEGQAALAASSSPPSPGTSRDVFDADDTIFQQLRDLI